MLARAYATFQHTFPLVHSEFKRQKSRQISQKKRKATSVGSSCAGAGSRLAGRGFIDRQDTPLEYIPWVSRISPPGLDFIPAMIAMTSAKGSNQICILKFAGPTICALACSFGHCSLCNVPNVHLASYNRIWCSF